jgi:hypothetical protein
MASTGSISQALLAAASFASQMLFVAAALIFVAMVVPLLVVTWIMRRELKEYEEDMKLLYPEEPETADVDASGKRPGQFSIFDLLVLTTVAAVACGIVRLPMHVVLKMFALTAVWFGLFFWACGKPDARKARSLAYKRRVAVLAAIGSILVLSPYFWLRFMEQPSRHFQTDVAFMLILLLTGPLPAIWRAVSAVRAELAAARRKQGAARSPT